MLTCSQPGMGVARAGAARRRTRTTVALATRYLGRDIFTTGGAQDLQERLAPGFQAGLQLVGAVAVAAGPGLLAREVAAAAPMVGVLHPDELQVLLPVGALLVERLVAEADLDPAQGAVAGAARLRHVAQILVPRHGALAQGAVLDRLEQGLFPAGAYTRRHQIPHTVENSPSGTVIPPPGRLPGRPDPCAKLGLEGKRVTPCLPRSTPSSAAK